MDALLTEDFLNWLSIIFLVVAFAFWLLALTARITIAIARLTSAVWQINQTLLVIEQTRIKREVEDASPPPGA